MQPWNRLRILAFSSALVLFLSAMAFQPALADDSTPPPAVPSSPTTPSASSVSAADNSSLASVPHGTDVVVLDRSGRSVPLASQKAAHIVASGDPIWCPLGVAPKDSIGGCSAAYTKFGTYATTDLLNWLYIHDPSKAGVIWIEAGYNSSVAESGNHSFTLNGSTGSNPLPNMANFSLAIKGGWSGISGSTTTNSATPSTFNNASFTIKNWNAPITINDILVTGVTANPNEPYALSVQTKKGGITLNRVQVIDNYNGGFAAGAHLDTKGAVLGSPAPVTVNDSLFNDNYLEGLLIESDGAVTIHNLAADYNGNLGNSSSQPGAYINNWWDNHDQPVTLTGTNEFKGNDGDGLDIDSFGAVTLNNITAYDNKNVAIGYGVHIDNYHDTTPSVVNLTGTNLLTFNAQDGLWIQSNSNISLNNITSTDNHGNGAELDNCLQPASNTACIAVGKTVTLTGLNSFNRNSGGDGLNVLSSGAITISQVTANNNGSTGVALDNCAINLAGSCLTPLSYKITLTNASTFDNNLFDGFYISASGAVSLNTVTANFNNGYDGGEIFNAGHLLTPGAVTIGGSNVFNGNRHNGLTVISYGAITINNITADDNGQVGTSGYGVSLNNQGYDFGVNGATVITRMPVTLTGVNTFDHNYSGGLSVSSVGAISASNVTASHNGTVANGGTGIDLENSNEWHPNFAPLPHAFAANVTLSGFGTFENNLGNGLLIHSTGVVMLANLTADFNGDNGIWITTSSLLGPQRVTLSGVNTFYHNGWGTGTGDGLHVNNNGPITISNLSSTLNDDFGVYLDNCLDSGPNTACTTTGQSVTLTGLNSFNDNSYKGLAVYSSGAISISQVTANTNQGDGIYLDNCAQVGASCSTLLPYNVTLINASTFETNAGDGISIRATGAVSLINITASRNGGEGGLIINTGHLLTPGAVTISGSNVFNDNFMSGLRVFSYGAITLSNITADDNAQTAFNGYGVRLDNTGYDGGVGGATVITRMPVTLKGVNTFNGNYLGGLYVYSVGAIAVNNVSASNNGAGSSADGVYLDNQALWYPNFSSILHVFAANVTLSGFGSFEGNAHDGLELAGKGTLTLANLTAENNGNDGALIATTGWTGPQSVTLSGVNTFNDNGATSGVGYGLRLENDGTITISNLSASGNKGSGADLNNLTFAWPGKSLGVTLTGFNTFENNLGADGLLIQTDGSVSLSNITADGNHNYGVNVSATKNVTLMCASAFLNGTGFMLTSGLTGIMTLTGVHDLANTIDESLHYSPGTLHRTSACP